MFRGHQHPSALLRPQVDPVPNAGSPDTRKISAKRSEPCRQHWDSQGLAEKWEAGLLQPRDDLAPGAQAAPDLHPQRAVRKLEPGSSQLLMTGAQGKAGKICKKRVTLDVRKTFPMRATQHQSRVHKAVGSLSLSFKRQLDEALSQPTALQEMLDQNHEVPSSQDYPLPSPHAGCRRAA